MGLEGGVKDRRDERTKMKRSPIFAKLLHAACSSWYAEFRTFLNF